MNEEPSGPFHDATERPGLLRRTIACSARHPWLAIALAAAALVYAAYAIRQIRLDAIPDLSDTQVIVYSRWDRSPDLVEDQVTYPIVTALLGAPRVKAVRGFSDFGYSYVYIVFADGTDLYWARSRVLEYLQKINGSLPPGVTPALGPDATGVGWVFQYALVDHSGTHDAAALRTYQDWYLRYALQSVPGVAEVAGIGGFQKQIQVTVDPVRLQAFGLSMGDVAEAIRRNNNETGGRLLEWSGREYMVRARGYATNIAAFGEAVVKTGRAGTPVLMRDVADIQLGPQLRRGVSDLDGRGDTVGGIVVMRHGENALNVIRRVRARLEELKPSMPPGVTAEIAYDRSELIRKAIGTLKEELLLEMLVVSLVIMFFLWHVPSASVPIVTIPVAVALGFIPMQALGVSSNIMSLSGIAISIGVLVDGAIVEVENACKKLELWHVQGQPGDHRAVLLEAIQEVAPSVFFSLLIVAVSFLPVFTLVEQEGRLFRPLAMTKTLVIAVAALLAVTLDPAMRLLFVRVRPFRFRPRALAAVANALAVGRYYSEERHPVSRVLFALYERPCRWVLRHPRTVIALAVLAAAATVPLYLRLGSEFMPPLNEGTLLYMPTTLPGISVTEAQRLLETQDRILRGFPEVASVFGKAGRIDSSTDPAPLSMMETTIVLKPTEQWRPKPRWFSRGPKPLRAALGHVWPEHIAWEELVGEMDRALRIPGCVNAWTMPIKGRIDMLSTGVRTPLGIKILGSDLHTIEQVGQQLEQALRPISGTRSVFAERATGGWFVDIVPDREALARYGLSIDDLQSVVSSAIGGDTVATVVEGRERTSVNLRYARDLRADLDQLRRVLVTARRPDAAADGAQVPLGELAEIAIANGPAMIRDENGMLAGYVYVDIAGRDVGGYVREARAAVERQLRLPTGCALTWSGQYENMQRVRARLKVVVPVTLLLIFLLLYLNMRSAAKSLIVMLAVPFSALGAVWLMSLLHYNVSIAAWVGMIALMGLDAETGVFMLLYLDLACADARRRGQLRNAADLHEAIVHGAVRRIRPKLMTVSAAAMGLMPILWSTGTGADLMKRVAAPMIGGLFTSFLMELLVYPAIYYLATVKSSGRT